MRPMLRGAVTESRAHGRIRAAQSGTKVIVDINTDIHHASNVDAMADVDAASLRPNRLRAVWGYACFAKWSRTIAA